VADNQRIEDLRRRVQKDPSSIAFAQLAEECRRAGRFEEAVEVCEAGLKLHPGYLSARVTLGRALIELNDLDTALLELTTVLSSAPENLAAIRGVAEIHHRQNDLPAALAQYRIALSLARNDPDLQRTVDELAREIEPPPPPALDDGLSFEQMQAEFLKLAPAPRRPAPATEAAADASADIASAPPEAEMPSLAVAPSAEAATTDGTETEAAVAPAAETSADSGAPSPTDPGLPPGAASARTTPATLEVAELERFLDAINVARAGRGA
jgi:tetratricopeptide (TPR) repeat protein